MIISYIALTLRQLTRHRITSSIYIASLSVGFTIFILTFLFIRDELTYDQFHLHSDRIYSVVETDHFYDFSNRSTPVPLAGELVTHCNDIENFVRIARVNGVIKIGDLIFNERVYMADIQFFDVFTFPLSSGNPQTALQSKNSLVITESYAKKFFGEKDPFGEVITIIIGDQKIPFRVSAISEDPPKNSTIQYNILVNIENLNTSSEPSQLFNWNSGHVTTYLLLKDGADIGLIENEILNTCKDKRSWFYDLRNQYSSLVETGETFTYSLQGMRDLYLGSSNIFGTVSGDIKRIYLLAVIAICILAIGIVNFLNITFVRISGRSVEVGLRKCFGAGKMHFLHQFLTESLVIALISFLVGILIASLLLPVFNGLVGKSFNPGSIFSMVNMIVFFLLVVFIGLITSIYPVLLMSNFRIVDIFKGKIRLGYNGIFQRSLLFLQYVVSFFFIVAAFTVTKQMKYIEEFDLGFQKSDVIVIQLQGRDAAQNLAVLKQIKNRANNINTVQFVSGCETTPNRTVLQGAIDVEGKRIDVHINGVDFEYINTMKMEIIEGRDFSYDFATDTFSIIINQKLAKEFSDSPIGKNIRIDNLNTGTIIGVVKDYNFMSLREEIKPTILKIGTYTRYNFALARIDKNSISQTIKEMEGLWKEIQPDKVFLYSILDEDLDDFYNEEERLNKIIKSSSFLIVIITCIGIFGLTLYTSNQRNREFGIRKTVGATFMDIIRLVSRDTLILSIIAFLITSPLSYYCMINWLERFAYKTDINYLTFVLAGLIVMSVSFITIFYLAIRAALSNPVESLKRIN